MKIGIVVFDISEKAGTQRAVINLANLLNEFSSEYEIYILSLNSSGIEAAFPLSDKVRVIGLDIDGQKKNKLSYYNKVIFSIKKQIDLFHFAWLIGTTHAINSVISIFAYKVKVVGCEHMNYDACPKLSKLARRIAYPRLNYIITLTANDASKYTFIDIEKIKVIPNSLSFFCEKQADLNSKKIIAAGRLTYQKGFDILIMIINNIRNELDGWYVEIYGEGEMRKGLDDLIVSMNLQDIILLKGSTDNLKEKFQHSSIYVMPSRWEGLPMTLIESQGCGLPGISFKCPEGPAEIIQDEKNGFLVDVGDIYGFGRKIIKLIQDFDLRKKQGMEAYRLSKRFDKRIIFEAWDKLLHN